MESGRSIDVINLILGIIIGAGVYELYGWIKRKRIPIFDEEEVIEGCTVRILHSSKTGEYDIGWWRGGKEDLPVIKKECDD